MKIPHTINENLLKEYTPSSQARNLVHETKRVLISENFDWDDAHVPPLTQLCVCVLVDNLERMQILQGLPCNDTNQLLETLPTNLSLPLVTSVIQDGVYWKRMVHDRWRDCVNHVDDYGSSWKRLYMEKHLQEYLESITPEGADLNRLRKTCRLVSDYVRRLDIQQLEMARPDPGDSGEYLDQVYTSSEPRDHIDLSPVIRGLQHLTQLHIQFGIKNVGTDYRRQWFQFSAADCRNIGKGVAEAENLRLLRIHNSPLDCDKTIALLSHMAGNTSLEVLDLSNCIIGDDGATAVAKFLKGRDKLQSVNLANNRIRETGVSALSFVVTQPECSPLEYLNLRLNTFGNNGAKFLASALIRINPKIQTLNLSCCNLNEESGALIGEMLTRNTVLVEVDLSNNELGTLAGEALEVGVSQNKCLQYLDLRMTSVSKVSQMNINRYLHLNRIRARKGERAADRELWRLQQLAERDRGRKVLEEEDDNERGAGDVLLEKTG